MIKFITTQPKCSCGASLEISSVVVDLVNCAFIISTDCIVCEESIVLNLSLTDFIELNLLTLGGSNGKENS